MCQGTAFPVPQRLRELLPSRIVEPLNIDFQDRADIRAKLPLAQARLDALEAALRGQVQEVEDWREYVAVLARRAELGPPEPEVADNRPTPLSRDAQPLDLVVEVVNREKRKIRAKHVGDILRSEGHEISNEAVSNALFYGAKRADPPRIESAPGRGFYAPLGYNPFLEGATVNGTADPAQNPDERGLPTPTVQLGREQPPGDQLIPDRPGHPSNMEGAPDVAHRAGD